MVVHILLLLHRRNIFPFHQNNPPNEHHSVTSAVFVMIRPNRTVGLRCIRIAVPVCGPTTAKVRVADGSASGYGVWGGGGGGGVLEKTDFVVAMCWIWLGSDFSRDMVLLSENPDDDVFSCVVGSALAAPPQ